MEINWTIVIIGIIVSFTISIIVNAIKEIKIAKIKKEIAQNVDYDKLEAIKNFEMR